MNLNPRSLFGVSWINYDNKNHDKVAHLVLTNLIKQMYINNAELSQQPKHFKVAIS